MGTVWSDRLRSTLKGALGSVPEHSSGGENGVAGIRRGSNAPALAGIEEATRLTAAGKLGEATTAIQSALGRDGHPPAAHFGTLGTMSVERVDVIDRSPARTSSRLIVPDSFVPGDGERTGATRPISEPTAPGRWVDGTFSNRYGCRDYRLYVPGGYTGQAVPMLVMLHGCTQSADDFAAGTLMNSFAEAKTFLALYPTQPSSANLNRCWNWFTADNQQREGAEPSLLAGLIGQITAQYHVDVGGIFVAGLSSGAAMAAIMAATYPELFSGIGVHSGLPYGAAHDLPTAFTAMRGGGQAPDIGTRARSVPMIAFHGDRDSTVNSLNGDRLVDQWLGMPDGPGQGRGAADSAAPEVRHSPKTGATHAYTRFLYRDGTDRPRIEKWIVHQAGHAWSGGSPGGSYTDPKGPDASAEMVRFFDEHRKGR